MRAQPIALALLTVALPAGAQEAARVSVRGAGWLGVAYELRWVEREGICQPRVVVESVVEGAPADRAGLRAGDAILALDGDPLRAGGLEILPTRLRPGDPVRLRVLRPPGRVQEIVAVADRRPDRPPVVLRSARPDGVAASGAPVVRLAGDTLIVHNLDPRWRPQRGYWIAQADGRTEYRRASRYRPTELDRRVATVMACAAETREVAAPPAPPAADLRRFQARADSLREVLARRALSRPDAERGRILRDLEAASIPPGPPDVHVFAFRVGDHVAAAERGVAGAEITALEPELAEYFRGARDGLLVLRVAPGSPAARAGLRPGDVITRADGRRLDSVAALRRLLAEPETGGVELGLVRHGRRQTVTIRRD